MNTIVKMLFGSHLYGTNTPTSDKDYKGIFLPDKKDIILGRVSKSINNNTNKTNEKNSADDIDEEMYSLHYFIELACQGQTVALDMLHASEKVLINSSEIWEDLQRQKSKFYTKNLNALVGYAQHQAAKYGVKGSRLAEAKEVLEFFNHRAPEKLSDIWDKLPLGEHIKKLPPNPLDKNQIPIYEVCGKKFLATSKVFRCYPTLQKFIEAYGERAKMAEESKGIDWKAISHAFRAAYQVKHILLDGGFEYPLLETDFIKTIKQGKLPYLKVAAVLEDLIDEVKKLSKQSVLPEKVDRNYWDNWLYDIILYECDWR